MANISARVISGKQNMKSDSKTDFNAELIYWLFPLFLFIPSNPWRPWIMPVLQSNVLNSKHMLMMNSPDYVIDNILASSQS